ncbi:hypothetical protein PINS_up000574 [Pythium insidiosum]|nr:hypothetical protein PINS_up000574 [Pythium insidiosum]
MSRASAGAKRDAVAASESSSAVGRRRVAAADREHAIITELLSTIGDVNELGRPPSRTPGSNGATSSNGNSQATATAVKRRRANGSEPATANAGEFAMASDADSSDDDDPVKHDDRRRRDAKRSRAPTADNDADDDDDDDDGNERHSDRSSNAGQQSSAASRHTRLTELEQQVRELERENLHLKQTLLLGKSGSVMLPGARSPQENTQQLLGERTRVVQEMVDLLNAPFLSLGDAARVWHDECRVGVGVREWDAFGRLATISLWNMIRSVFANIAVDIVELRPHLPDGEMVMETRE